MTVHQDKVMDYLSQAYEVFSAHCSPRMISGGNREINYFVVVEIGKMIQAEENKLPQTGNGGV